MIFFKLKRIHVSRHWKGPVALEKIVRDMVPGITLGKGFPKVILNSFRASQTTACEALKKIKEDYLLAAYFRNGKLFMGLPYTEFDSDTPGVQGAVAKYSFQQNIIDDDLKYRSKDDVRIKAKVTAMHPDGTKTTVPDVGDPDGVERTITLRTKSVDVAELKALALRKLAGFKYDGFTGSFTTFGVPYIIHSGVADLVDPLRPQRNGRYLVDSVKTSFGVQGFRREVELSKRVSQ